VSLIELEARRDELARRADELARVNQAARMHVLLNARRGSIGVIVALVIAFAIGAATGAIVMPTERLYLVLCR
jgi:hypothetical protein